MYATGNPPENYGQIQGGCSFPWMIAVDYCFPTMPYSMQLTEQIPNDPPRMGGKITTTSNHPSTPTRGMNGVTLHYCYPRSRF